MTADSIGPERDTRKIAAPPIAVMPHDLRRSAPTCYSRRVTSFSDIIAGARRLGSRRFVVAQAADPVVLEAVEAARREGFCAPVLVGVRGEIEAAAREAGVPLGSYRIADVAAKADSASAAVRLVASGEGDVLVKGLLPTSELLKPVLDKATGLGRGRLISHVGVFLVPGFDRFVLVTDAALCIAPDLAQKADIVRNAFETAHGLGIADPIAAILCAIENVNPKMPATADAVELVRMAERGEIAGGRVVGPLALDCAVDPEAARHKGIASPLAGRADILVAPDIEAGNILYKALAHFARAEVAGILVGARAPIVVTSRSDSAAGKLHSMALATLCAAAPG
jgi:phosphate butyryltransferase